MSRHWMEEERLEGLKWMGGGKGSRGGEGRGGGAHRHGKEERGANMGAHNSRRRATVLAAGTAALVLLSACLPGASGINCFHGILTVGEGGQLVTDASYWQDAANDPNMGQSKDCTIFVDQFHNTCSMFCKTFETLTSGVKIHECRRFCMTGAQCKKSFDFQVALCDSEMQRPLGNRKLIGCTLKCHVEDESNLSPSCGEIPDTGNVAGQENVSIAVNSGYTRCATIGASAAHHTVQAGWFLALISATMMLLLQ